MTIYHGRFPHQAILARRGPFLSGKQPGSGLSGDLVEASDQAAGSAALAIGAVAALMEAADAFDASATGAVSASGALSEAPDHLVAGATAAIVAWAALGEGDDTLHGGSEFAASGGHRLFAAARVRVLAPEMRVRTHFAPRKVRTLIAEKRA